MKTAKLTSSGSTGSSGGGASAFVPGQPHSVPPRDVRTPLAEGLVDGLSRRAFLRKAGGTAALASVGALGLLLPRRAEAATVQRPLSDFLNAQGTFCFPDGMGGCLLFFPPVPLYGGVGTADNRMIAWADYAGIADRWAGGAFGTQISGTVTERAWSDGRAQVDVTLQATHALTFVTAGYPPAPLLFGHYAPDVLAGADGAFGRTSYHVSFINTAPGAPLPDLIQLFFLPAPGQEVLGIIQEVTATGTLRSAFGVPDGTPGRLDAVNTLPDPKPVVNLRPVGG